MAKESGMPASQAATLAPAMKAEVSASEKKPCFNSKWLPLFLSLLFLVVFEVVYFTGKTGARATSQIANPDLLRWFDDLGVLIWVAVGVLVIIKLYFLFFLRLILGMRKIATVGMLLYALVFGVCMYLGYFLVYREPRNTEVAMGIIDFFWKPLLYAWIASIAAAFLLFALSFKKR